MNQALLKAIREDTKELAKENEFKIEKDFIVDNWQFFAETKGAVKSAFFNSPKTGNELLQTLGLQQVCIHKVKKEDLLKSLINMESSVIFNRFLSDLNSLRECTTFFVVNKNAMVMSNVTPLVVPGRFIHKFPSQGELNDIYWQWAKELLGKVRFY